MLRRFRPSDAEAMFHNWASDEEVTRWLSWKAYRSADEVKARLIKTEKRYADPAFYVWCLHSKETGEPVGSIGAVSADDALGSIGIGWCLSRAQWGKGLIPEAARAVVRFLFETAGFNRIEIKLFADDIEGGRVAEEIGMKKEGVVRDGGADSTGALRDVAVWSVLRRDF